MIVVDNTTPSQDGSIYRTAEPYPKMLLDGADDVWRIGNNLGCLCNIYPGLAHPEYNHVVFADDDHIPGKDALRYMLTWAERLGGNFATIGQTGRNFLLDWAPGKRYSGRNVPCLFIQGIAECHLTCRAHLVRTDLLHYLFPFRQRLLNKFGEEAAKLCAIHNDFLMCLGIQTMTGLRSFCTMKPEPQSSLFMEDLDNDGKGLWRRPEHFIERNRMVDMALAVGWKEIK